MNINKIVTGRKNNFFAASVFCFCLMFSAAVQADLIITQHFSYNPSPQDGNWDFNVVANQIDPTGWGVLNTITFTISSGISGDVVALNVGGYGGNATRSVYSGTINGYITTYYSSTTDPYANTIDQVFANPSTTSSTTVALSKGASYTYSGLTATSSSSHVYDSTWSYFNDFKGSGVNTNILIDSVLAFDSWHVIVDRD